ncbi:MAG: restriction endonuclease [Burkholderiales bacterium]|nr:restriction endonuclease [Burkholderiales bacterium]
MPNQHEPAVPLTFASLIEKGFEILFISHAEAILTVDFPQALEELSSVLTGLRLPITEIIGGGGGETKFTQRLRRALAQDLGWKKHVFRVGRTIDGRELESTSHEVDHVRTLPAGTIALEIEWNNKDPFFDRDLENFKRLHAEGAISVGVLITRGTTLQANMRQVVQRFAAEQNINSYDTLTGLGYQSTARQRNAVMKRVNRARNPIPFAIAWSDNFVSDKYGAATTHWDKLKDRVDRGVGNPCPLLLIGLPAEIVTFDGDRRIEHLEEQGDAEEGKRCQFAP